METSILFFYIGTASEFIPVIAGIIYYKKEAMAYRFFLYYLAIGALMDASKTFITDDEPQRWMYHFYSLFEIMFLLWFLRTGLYNKKLKSAVMIVALLLVPFWLYCHFIYELSPLDYSTVFDLVTFILVASLAAYRLLIMTQDDSSFTSSPDFWFLTGIFIYFFTFNFLFGLLDTEFVGKIWFVHNSLSVLISLILAKGFWTIGKTEKLQAIKNN